MSKLFIFLGIAIFIYVTKRRDTIFAPIIALFTGTVEVASKGTQELVNVSSETATAGLNKIQNITGGTPESAVKSPPPSPRNSLNKSLNTSIEEKQEDYIADDSASPIQHGKMGWCFIGEDRGFRSCEYVGANDKCMSGDIFPSKDVCMNPNLRA